MMTEGGDLCDTGQAGETQSEPKLKCAQQLIQITDDWPEVVPVTEAEVRMIEAYFGDLLDELFGPLP
ncbi:hypothetical protein [Rhodophyticola porphyridii]|uniref:hypothetical protein n=1 Tax=Rhodophyticola porphyridii TaxID=1852017 RepID=UPI0035CF7DEB